MRRLYQQINIENQCECRSVRLGTPTGLINCIWVACDALIDLYYISFSCCNVVLRHSDICCFRVIIFSFRITVLK